MSIERELLRFVATEVVLGEVAPGEPLVSSGRVDSLGLLRILGHIDERYGVWLMAVGTPEDFDSVAALAAAIERAQAGSAAP